MLMMVLERYHTGKAGAVFDRLRHQGRLLPSGVRHIDSWVDVEFSRGFQLLDALDLTALTAWTQAWTDLMELEVIQVRTSAEAFALAADWESQKHLPPKTIFRAKHLTRRHDGAITEMILQSDEHWFDAAIAVPGEPPRLIGGAASREGAELLTTRQLSALNHRACTAACDATWIEIKS